MIKKRCTFKNLEENWKKPGRNSENLEKISKNLLATLSLVLSNLVLKLLKRLIIEENLVQTRTYVYKLLYKNKS